MVLALMTQEAPISVCLAGMVVMPDTCWSGLQSTVCAQLVVGANVWRPVGGPEGENSLQTDYSFCFCEFVWQDMNQHTGFFTVLFVSGHEYERIQV